MQFFFKHLPLTQLSPLKRYVYKDMTSKEISVALEVLTVLFSFSKTTQKQQVAVLVHDLLSIVV